MIYEERYKIDYQDTRHHTSLRVTKPNGDTGIIAHFGGDYWYVQVALKATLKNT